MKPTPRFSDAILTAQRLYAKLIDALAQLPHLYDAELMRLTEGDKWRDLSMRIQEALDSSERKLQSRKFPRAKKGTAGIGGYSNSAIKIEAKATATSIYPSLRTVAVEFEGWKQRIIVACGICHALRLKEIELRQEYKERDLQTLSNKSAYPMYTPDELAAVQLAINRCKQSIEDLEARKPEVRVFMTKWPEVEMHLKNLSKAIDDLLGICESERGGGAAWTN